MNPRGGAVAYDHPIEPSGGKVTTSLAHQLQQEEATYGIVGMNVGGDGAVMSLWEW